MLLKCDEFGDKWKIGFNPEKSIIFQGGINFYDDNNLNCYINNKN